MLTKVEETPEERLVISEPNFRTASIRLRSTSPFVYNKFSARQQQAMMAKQEAGSQAKNKLKREPKVFDDIWPDTVHWTEEGWHGIPCSAFRDAMITACKTVGFKMTMAKLSIFVQADGYDKTDQQPLVKISGPKPRRFDAAVRLAMGTTDIATRGVVDNWEAVLRVEWDADQFSPTDILNLLNRAGKQVGVGAGRPGSRTSNGQGWGTWTIVN